MKATLIKKAVKKAKKIFNEIKRNFKIKFTKKKYFCLLEKIV